MKKILTVAFLWASFLSASNAQNVSLDQLITPQEQVSLGVDQMTTAQKEQLKQIILRNMSLVAEMMKKQGGGFPSRTGSYTGSLIGHWIKENVDRGKMIILDDGSVWEVDRFERLDSSLWLKMSSITIVESSNGSPGFNYMLINTDDGEKVHARPISK